MASSDEEDLEALRNAALASLRQKQAAQEPQGIQVVSRIAIQTPNQYNQQVPHPEAIPHPEGHYDYTEYGEIPFAFQQAVLNRQARGRGRGFHRGRGRGRGNWFPPKPEGQSALIVIQPSGGQKEEVNIETSTSKDSRPFLLRPQDKWASSENGSQNSTPTRPRDTSKFSRYDDATDSEDDDDVVGRRRHESESGGMDMSFEDVSSDTEIEVHKNCNNDTEVIEHFNEVEVHNSEQDLNESGGVTEKDLGLTDTECAIDISQNVAIDEVHSDVNTSKTFEKSENGTSFDTEVDNENKVEVTGTNEEKYLQSANININEENSLVNENIDSYLNTNEKFDSTPLRDEPTPVQDELRQDDSVSNSYSAFSRFNRRNRSNSESAEDSAEESDNEVRNVSGSRKSSISRESSKSRTDSDNESADSVKSDEGLSATELKESSSSHLTLTKDNQTSQESISSVSLKSNSRKSSSASSSSSSDSDSDSSSSSSSSSSSESETSLENSKSQKLKSVTKSKIISKTDTRKLDSPVHRDFKSESHIERKRSPDNNLNDRNLNLKGRKDKQKDTSSKGKDYSGREIERDKTSPIKEKTSKERSYYRKSVKERVSPEVKADPEFDATNYRDETMYQKNDRRSRHGKDRVDYDRKHDRENWVGNKKVNSKSRDEFEKREDQGKSKDKRERPIEKRYFEEIGRLKMEEARVSRDSVCKKDNETSYRQRKRSRSNSAESKTASKNHYQGAESNKSDRNAKVSKSDSYLTSSKAARSQKELKTESKERRKSVENLKRKSSDEKGKLKVKNSKDELKTKRRSLEEKLQRLASQTEKSDFDSGSEKNVSSLSDLSSDSETETWRDKKHGASRKTADIELERRRREQKEREKERQMIRRANRNNLERGDGDRDQSKKSKHRVGDSKVEKYDSGYNEKQTYRKGDNRDRRKDDYEDSSRQRNYHKKHTIFYEKDHRKKFEELSSDSDSDVRKGVISVVKTGQKKASEQIPSLLDINVSKPKSVEKDHKIRNKSPKKERLIIHVEKSSDDEISSTKSKKKKVKKRKKVSSDDDETVVKQIVNVTFDKEIVPKKSSKSVYDRLGVAVNKKPSSMTITPDDTEFQKSHEITIPGGGKRIKLSSSGKYHVANKQKPDESKGEEDVALNLRIQKIQEKNAEILRRKMEVEQDKEKYG